MNKPVSKYGQLSFVNPNPQIHAPITLGWFEADYGRETLLLMGNAENEIDSPSLEGERATLSDFIEQSNKKEQLTWMLCWGGYVIGVAWVELIENHNVKPPSIHLMIGNKEYRGKGIGTATMSALIEFIKSNFNSRYVYSRHLSSNIVVDKMNKSLGFEYDGESYKDKNGLEWQNVKMLV